MADQENPEAEFSYSYDNYAADGEPADPTGEPVDCPACRGTGKDMLLFIAKPCKACGGTRKTASAAPDSKKMVRVEERVPGHWVTTSLYDGLERLRWRGERFVPDPPAAPATAHEGHEGHKGH